MSRNSAPLYREDLAWIHHHGFSDFSEEAAPGILRILADRGISGGRVIDVGCGSGVLSRELTAAGFRVLGIDASPAMIAIARDTAPSAEFRIGRFDDAELPRCDAAIAIGEVLNYGTFEGLSRYLRAAATSLRPGGVLLFDIAESDAYPHSEEHRVGGDGWSVIAIKERTGTRLSRRILTFRELDGGIRRDEEIHLLELYPREGVVAEAKNAGFQVRVRRSYGSRRLPPGHAVYVCQKPPTEDVPPTRQPAC